MNLSSSGGYFFFTKKFKFILFIHLTKYTFRKKDYEGMRRRIRNMVSDQTLSKRT